MNEKYKKSRIIFYCLLIIISVTVFLEAKPIDLETAKEVAVNWYSERSGLTKSSVVANYSESKNMITLLYIFNFNPTGYVIVSGDDIVIPILGYSISRPYSENNHPLIVPVHFGHQFRFQFGHYSD